MVARRYEIERRLGSGAMGDVFLAHDSLLRKQVALKVLRPDLAENRDTVRRFLREVALAHSVTHPNIVRIYDTGEEQGLPFFTMEFLQGENLEDLLRAHGSSKELVERLSIREIRDIALAVLDAIEAAHRVGVVHRDLKPGNVMLTHRGAIVMDFGVAGIEELPEIPANSQLRSLVRTEAGTIFGSPAYMAPELWEGAPATAQSDLYAFGVMLYQMLTGQLPYEAKTPAAYLQKLGAGPPPPIRHFRRNTPWNLVRLVHRCMATDPNERPPSAAAAANLLSPLRSRDRKRMAIVAGAAGLCVAALLVFRSSPSWRAYGVPDALAEADLAAAVRAWDVGDEQAALGGLERLADRAPESAAVAFWLATVRHDIGDEPARLAGCARQTAWVGSKHWKMLAEAACEPRYTLPGPLRDPDRIAEDDELRPLLPLAVSFELVPRLEAGGAEPTSDETTAERVLEELQSTPSGSPMWGLPVRWQIARADLELALGRVTEASKRLRGLADEHAKAPIVRRKMAWLEAHTGHLERASAAARPLHGVDPTPDIRASLQDGRLEHAWRTIETFAGHPREAFWRSMWCGYALRFEMITLPPRCKDLPPGLARALWAGLDEEGMGHLSSLEASILERQVEVSMGRCDSRDVRSAVLTHAPPPFETYLAELDVEAALCDAAPSRADLGRARELSARLQALAPLDPWVLLAEARVHEARGSMQAAQANRATVLERWRDADAHLPLVARLREAHGAQGREQARAHP